MINSLDPFIEYGYYTIPLNSQTIERDKDGKKVFKSAKGWQKYMTEYNELATTVGGIVTGPINDPDHAHAEVIAIDCDEIVGYNIVSRLDPDCPAIIRSVGKMEEYTDEEGNKQKRLMDPQPATFLYKRTEADPATLNKGPLGIEIFNGGSARMVFLPTEGNKTKEPWTELPDLTEMPEVLRQFLHTLKPPVKEEKQSTTTLVAQSRNIGMRLAPLMERLVNGRGTYIPVVFKVITPIAYRNDEYKRQGHLHPNNVNDRSDYLFKISTMLGTDISINEELYLDSMTTINNMMDNPLPAARLKSEITTPMVSGSATYQDKQLWQYDPHWESQALMGMSKKGELLEYFYDDILREVFEVNHTANIISTHSLPKIKQHLNVTLTEPFGKGVFDANIQNYTTVLEPHKEFGLEPGTHNYNVFKATQPLLVLNNPALHAEDYIKPKAFIEYMESLVPDEIDRTYLLRFIRTKLTTFKYSPVILYLVGKGGSGKGLFTNLLQKFIGSDYISKDLGGSQLMESSGFNAWMVNKYFVHFDELHKELGKFESAAATEKLKRYSGSETFSVRLMNQNSGTGKMLATIILTQNGSNLYIEPDDRRFLYIDTPNALGEQRGAQVVYAMDNNMDDIAYYLATEYTNLPSNEYMRAPANEAKQAIMISNIPVATRLVYYIKTQRYEDLFQLAFDANVEIHELTEWRSKSRIKADTLIAIHNGITGLTPDNPKAMFRDLFKKELSEQPKHPYTGGDNTLYCIAHGFDAFTSALEINLEDLPTEQQEPAL